MKKFIAILLQKKYLFITGIGLFSSISTFLFFYFSNTLFFKFEPKKEKINVYQIAKE